MPVTAQRVAVVEAADHLCGGFGLVAMQQVKRHERVFDFGERPAHGNRVFPKLCQRSRADGEDAVQLSRGIRSVIPEMRVGMRATLWPRVLVGDEVQAARLCLVQKLVERGVLVDAGCELPISVLDGDLVPCAYSY